MIMCLTATLSHDKINRTSTYPPCHQALVSLETWVVALFTDQALSQHGNPAPIESRVVTSFINLALSSPWKGVCDVTNIALVQPYKSGNHGNPVVTSQINVCANHRNHGNPEPSDKTSVTSSTKLCLRKSWLP
jgi:hypothetical protein